MLQIRKTKDGWEIITNYGWNGLQAHTMTVIYLDNKQAVLDYIEEVLTEDVEYRHVRKDKKVLKKDNNG